MTLGQLQKIACASFQLVTKQKVKLNQATYYFVTIFSTTAMNHAISDRNFTTG
jgi:hypothetical protein